MKKLVSLMMVFALIFTIMPLGVLADSGYDTETGVRFDKDGNLLYKPEDVGAINNPVVTGLISPAPDNDWYAYNIAWKEQAYGIEYDYDTCAWNDREMKWITAYVSGTPYDIITRTNFPTTAVKGLLEPLDDILPVNDTRYFSNAQVFNGATYGVTAKTIGNEAFDCGEVYGVWYNKDMFEENGLTTPAELWENGEWTFDALLEAAEALTQDNDNDGIIDIYGYGSWARQLFTIGNGAKTVELANNGVELVWDTPEYINGLDFMVSMAPYSNNNNDFTTGTIAMYGERIQNASRYSQTSPNCQVDFETDWVPFPKGPDGEGQMGYISGGSEMVSIGKDAKNIEGAKVFICADIAKFDYVDVDDAPFMIGVTDDMVRRVLSCQDDLIVDYTSKIGNMGTIMEQVWSDAKAKGSEYAIEKNTPKMQEQVYTIMQSVEHDHTYDNACDKRCNICGETRAVADHVYDNACDLFCNVCGYEKKVYTNEKITGLTASNVALSYPSQRYGNNLSTMFDGNASAVDGNGMQLNWTASTDQKIIRITLNETADISALNIYWGNNDWNAVPAQTYYVFFVDEDGNYNDLVYEYSDNATGQDGALRNDSLNIETPVEGVKVVEIVVTAHYKKGDLAIRELEIFEAKYTPIEHVYDNDSDTKCNECGATREIVTPPTISNKGANIRLESDEVKAGLRFASTLSKAELGIVGDYTYSADADVTFGMFMLPKSLLKDSGYTTIKELYESGKENQILDAVAKRVLQQDETTLTYTAVLTDIPEDNWVSTICAVPYVLKDGEYYFGVQMEKSYYDVAKAARNSTYSDQEIAKITDATAKANAKAIADKLQKIIDSVDEQGWIDGWY